jgi:hypothetical protein
MPVPILDYSEVLEAVKRGRSHLLLGNGFSIGCDPIFKYTSLYDRAVKKGLSARAQQVFGLVGNNNFEGVMRLLRDSHWVAHTYGLVAKDRSDMLADLEIVKTALVEAVADSHLEHSGSVDDAKKAVAYEFLKPYHNIFTTNYDLLTYWLVMSPKVVQYRDGFGDDPDEPEAPYVVFSFQLGDQRGIFYIHGALHLYVADGIVTKHCWSRTGEKLTTLIRHGMGEGNNPLFVAEGSSDRKLQQISESSYLSYALSKLGRVQGRLVVFGHALAACDDHLRKEIARNQKITDLYISVRDDKNTMKADEATQRIDHLRAEAHMKPLNVTYFRAHSAKVWG